MHVNHKDKKFDLTGIDSFDAIKDQIRCKLINYEWNKEELETRPHVKVGGLAMVFQIPFENDDEFSVKVNQSLFDRYGVSIDTLSNVAIKNTVEKDKPVIVDMFTAAFFGIGDALDIPWEEHLENLDLSEGFFALTNTDMKNGAMVMTYPGILEDIAEKLQGDFFIIPSSIHEVLILKDNGDMTMEEVANTIREVNTDHVSPEDRLDDKPYFYDSKERAIKMEKPQEKKSIHDRLKEGKALLNENKPENVMKHVAKGQEI